MILVSGCAKISARKAANMNKSVILMAISLTLISSTVSATAQTGELHGVVTIKGRNGNKEKPFVRWDIGDPMLNPQSAPVSRRGLLYSDDLEEALKGQSRMAK